MTEQFESPPNATHFSATAEKILTAGLTLVVERGLAAVEMKEIAQAAGVGRATLYRYYPSKQAFAYGLLQFYYQQHIAPWLDGRLQNLSGNGYEKVRMITDVSRELYHAFPDFLRFVGVFNHLFGYQDDPQTLGELFKDVHQNILPQGPLYTAMLEGQQDGSLHPDFDPQVMTATYIESYLMFAQHIIAQFDTLRIEYDVRDPEQLLETYLQTFLRGIAA